MTYVLAIYLMMVIVVFVIARTTTQNTVLRGTIIVLGMGAPFFAVYVLVKACWANAPSDEATREILSARDDLEQARYDRFGGTKSLRSKFKAEYIHAMENTQKAVERVVGKVA